MNDAKHIDHLISWKSLLFVLVSRIPWNQQQDGNIILMNSFTLVKLKTWRSESYCHQGFSLCRAPAVHLQYFFLSWVLTHTLTQIHNSSNALVGCMRSSSSKISNAGQQPIFSVTQQTRLSVSGVWQSFEVHAVAFKGWVWLDNKHQLRSSTHLALLPWVIPTPLSYSWMPTTLTSTPGLCILIWSLSVTGGLLTTMMSVADLCFMPHHTDTVSSSL